MASKTEVLISALEPLAESHGLELVDVEVAGTSKNPILRVYLDNPEGGINLDQLAAAQQWVDEQVEAIDPFKCSYTLEVSSPGIDRPLRKPSDYERFAGEDTVVYLKKGETPAKVKGVLNGLDGDDVVLDTEPCEQRIARDRIKKAHIIGKIDFNAGRKAEK